LRNWGVCVGGVVGDWCGFVSSLYLIDTLSG
jgi:hypothetical protein